MLHYSRTCFRAFLLQHVTESVSHIASRPFPRSAIGVESNPSSCPSQALARACFWNSRKQSGFNGWSARQSLSRRHLLCGAFFPTSQMRLFAALVTWDTVVVRHRSCGYCCAREVEIRIGPMAYWSSSRDNDRVDRFDDKTNSLYDMNDLDSCILRPKAHDFMVSAVQRSRIP